jgi:hypothetical protein
MMVNLLTLVVITQVPAIQIPHASMKAHHDSRKVP